MNKPATIILVIGGQRSGKSELAEKLTLQASPSPVYIATCRPLDEEMERRVETHRKRREGQGWTTVESETLAGAGLVSGRSVLIDSATMLASNAFFAANEDDAEALRTVIDDFDRFVEQSHDSLIVVVSDEIGLGGVSGNIMTRRFADMIGLFNRHIAEAAVSVYLTVAGIPLQIK